MATAFTDDLGRCVVLAAPPQRIISLCPSQTETLFALGAGARVVGRTRWCIHPQTEVERVAAVGGTKKINIGRAAALRPDLFLCEKEENTPELVAQAEALAPVYVTDVRDIASALHMIRSVGAVVSAASAADSLASGIEMAFARLPRAARPQRVLYLIWREPWMCVGNDTYIGSLLAHLGLVNAVAELPGRYPTLTPGEFERLAPDRVLLSSEPYAFTQAHLAEVAALAPGAEVQCVDGEAFSWYGARMLPAAEYLGNLVAGWRH